MKFGKNLQKVVDISDPEWAPYWTNYKMLKKLIKELPTLVPTDDKSKNQQQNISNEMTESSINHKNTINRAVNATNDQNSLRESMEQDKSVNQVETIKPVDQKGAVKAMGKSPGEIAFFKLLHSEFKKSCVFFQKAEEEMSIREARVQEGYEIMQRPNSIMVNDKWSLLSKSLYRLYKDLLLLETYAIMTYVTFSKILKKHDKMTGFTTRSAFMGNVVSKANFTTYPKLIGMIKRTEALYEEVSGRLVSDGKESLYEDERLFINMINRLNNQALENEGAPLARPRKITDKESSESIVNASNTSESVGSVASSLKSLVEDNDADKKEAAVSVDNDKRDSVSCEGSTKRQRLK